MKTPYLFDVPKNGPTRREKLARFKSENGFQTHNCGVQMVDKDWGGQWMAVHMPTGYIIGASYGVKPGDSLIAMCAKICRLLDDSGAVGYGRTEAEAVREVCHALKIVCPL